MDQYLEVWSKYATFTGRSTRRDYWMFFLVHVIVCIVLAIISAIINTDILSNLYNLAVFVPSVAVGIRRMHDTNRSGWWLLVPIVSLFYLCEASVTQNNNY